MRTLTALLSWLVATAMLAVVVPTAWAQRTLVDIDGFAALAQRAAGDPGLQRAAAGEITAEMVQLIRARGFDVDPALVRGVATAYTAGPEFPPKFADISRQTHRDAFSANGTDEWVLDLGPMLRDTVFQQLLGGDGMSESPALTVSVPESLRDGKLRTLAGWNRWGSLGAGVLGVIAALSTLLAARRRGKALAGLGVSALLAGAAGWVGIEVVRHDLTAVFGAAGGTGTDISQVADVLVAYGIDSLHHWLNATLAAGGVLVVAGVFAAMLGGMRKS